MNTMNDFFRQAVLWDVEVWRLGAALLLIFSGFLSRRIISWLFGSFLRRRVGRTSVQWDDDFVELVPAPLALFIQVLLWYVAAAVLQLPTEPNVRRLVYQGLEVALAVSLTWVAFRSLDVLARVGDRVTGRTDSRLDDQLVPLLRKTLKVFLVVIVAVTIIQNLGYSVTSLIASLGIGGVALALAAKDAVANFFGSIVVFTDQPFHVGDWVEFGDVEGVVEEVGFRTTRVRRFDKSLVTVPNSTFTTTAIINHSRRPIRRVKMVVGLTYDTTPAQMRAFLGRVRALLASYTGLDAEAGTVVFFNEFADSSLNVLVQGFTETTDFMEFMSIQEDLMLKVMELVEEEGLEIAFPTRTVFVHEAPETVSTS